MTRLAKLMSEGIIGKKLGMTQVYQKDGEVVPLTAIEAGPCTVMQVKTAAKDGYDAEKLGFGTVKVKKSSKPAAKENPAPKYLREFAVTDVKTAEVGKKVDVSIFKSGDLVSVTGISKGKGFAGGVKRYHFHGGPKTHGQSDRHRAPGSLGSTTTPGRVYKGLRMAGHMGQDQVTVVNLEVYQADPGRNLLLLKGAVPGGKNGLLLIKKSTRGRK
jgi:large subunit ribosomal protein L3